MAVGSSLVAAVITTEDDTTVVDTMVVIAEGEMAVVETEGVTDLRTPPNHSLQRTDAT